jgi:hypothetical protein
MKCRRKPRPRRLDEWPDAVEFGWGEQLLGVHSGWNVAITHRRVPIPKRRAVVVGERS